MLGVKILAFAELLPPPPPRLNFRSFPSRVVLIGREAVASLSDLIIEVPMYRIPACVILLAGIADQLSTTLHYKVHFKQVLTQFMLFCPLSYSLAFNYYSQLCFVFLSKFTINLVDTQKSSLYVLLYCSMTERENSLPQKIVAGDQCFQGLNMQWKLHNCMMVHIYHQSCYS